jgi:hypothetical protein
MNKMKEKKKEGRYSDVFWELSDVTLVSVSTTLQGAASQKTVGLTCLDTPLFVTLTCSTTQKQPKPRPAGHLSFSRPHTYEKWLKPKPLKQRFSNLGTPPPHSPTKIKKIIKKDDVSRRRRLLLYCQLPDTNSHYISMDFWHLSWHFKFL